MQFRKEGKFITFLIIALLVLNVTATVSFGEQKSKKTEKRQSKANSSTEESVKSPKFTTNKFDITAEKLPPHYYGHDVEQLYANLERRASGQKKGEFETTEQYQKRLKQESALPVLGSLGLDGVFAFQLWEGLAGFSKKSTYDADSQEMKVELNLDMVWEEYGSIDKARKAAKFKINMITEEQYRASNAFGASMTVTERTYKNYSVAFNNYNIFSVSGTKIGGELIGAKLEVNIKIQPEEAKAAKSRLRVLAVCKLEEPPITHAFVHRKPTFKEPSEFNSYENYVNSRLVELWFYDIESGKVYMKISKASIEAERERSAAEHRQIREKYAWANELLKAVYKDLYAMSLGDSKDPGQGFADLVESVGLYNLFKDKGQLGNVPADVEALANETQEYRTKSYSSLSAEQKSRIILLNKKTLKAIYQDIYRGEE